MRKYLLYIPTPDGKHCVELDHPARNFDLAINIWGDVVPPMHELHGVMPFHKRGNMWPVIKQIGENLLVKSDIWKQYDAFCFICNDVEIDTVSLNQLFEQGTARGLDLWQASLQPNSVIGWTHTVQQPGGGVRVVPFVESMMPVFSRAALEKCLHTFDETESGWGIDILWPTLLDRSKIAVFDSVTAKVSRPMSSEFRMFSTGMTGREEGNDLIKRHGLRFTLLEQQ